MLDEKQIRIRLAKYNIVTETEIQQALKIITVLGEESYFSRLESTLQESSSFGTNDEIRYAKSKNNATKVISNNTVDNIQYRERDEINLLDIKDSIHTMRGFAKLIQGLFNIGVSQASDIKQVIDAYEKGEHTYIEYINNLNKTTPTSPCLLPYAEILYNRQEIHLTDLQKDLDLIDEYAHSTVPYNSPMIDLNTLEFDKCKFANIRELAFYLLKRSTRSIYDNKFNMYTVGLNTANELTLIPIECLDDIEWYRNELMFKVGIESSIDLDKYETLEQFDKCVDLNFEKVMIDFVKSLMTSSQLKEVNDNNAKQKVYEYCLKRLNK